MFVVPVGGVHNLPLCRVAVLEEGLEEEEAFLQELEPAGLRWLKEETRHGWRSTVRLKVNCTQLDLLLGYCLPNTIKNCRGHQVNIKNDAIFAF